MQPVPNPPERYSSGFYNHPSGPASQAGRQASERPNNQPSNQPISQPTYQPTNLPASQPGSQPGSQAASQAASQPSSQLANQPTKGLGGRPIDQPTMTPALQEMSQSSRATHLRSVGTCLTWWINKRNAKGIGKGNLYKARDHFQSYVDVVLTDLTLPAAFLSPNDQPGRHSLGSPALYAAPWGIAGHPPPISPHPPGLGQVPHAPGRWLLVGKITADGRT